VVFRNRDTEVVNARLRREKSNMWAGNTFHRLSVAAAGPKLTGAAGVVQPVVGSSAAGGSSNLR
jgi:hypothetical protein